jgi:hypothetical protein
MPSLFPQKIHACVQAGLSSHHEDLKRPPMGSILPFTPSQVPRCENTDRHTDTHTDTDTQTHRHTNTFTHTYSIDRVFQAQTPNRAMTPKSQPNIPQRCSSGASTSTTKVRALRGALLFQRLLRPLPHKRRNCRNKHRNCCIKRCPRRCCFRHRQQRYVLVWCAGWRKS